MKISRTPYYSSSWDMAILLYESLKTLKSLKLIWKNFIEAAEPRKMTSAKIRPIINFFRLRMQIWSQISVPIKPINLKILPDGTIYLKSHSRKWIQIQIRTYGPHFNLPFQSLASSLCRRPSFWRFPEHRITLRVGLCTSCSTSHEFSSR